MTTTFEKSYNELIENLNFSYFGLISMTILIGSILGGIAAMHVLQNDAPIWQLGICMSAAMTNNVLAIGQASTKWVFNFAIINTIVCGLLIAINL